MKIVSVAEMRALEAAAFASSITEQALQRCAGEAIAEEAFKLIGPGQRVVVLVGHGNNGRDGAVAAEWLARHQVPVDLVLAPRHAVTRDELAQLEAQAATVIHSENAREVEQVLDTAALAVDALAGIGTHGALREPLASLAQQLNASRSRRGQTLHVLALDIPSGIDSDSGAVPGEAVQADSTVTLGGVKQGLLRFPAAGHGGRLVPREIGIPEGADAALPYGCLDEAQLAGILPPRPLDAHKYRFGRVLVVAGSDHFPGAATLCSGGAARAGAGLVTLAATRDVRLAVAGYLPEVTYTQDDVRVADGPPSVHTLEPYLRSHNAIVLGPGLGRGREITAFVEWLLALRPADHTLVVDADGLVALADITRWQRLLGPNVVLTPHSGELERLIGHQLNQDEPMWALAASLAKDWNCVLVTKGPFTCIAEPSGRVDVWPRANPALSTGGTGDVLAGVTAGLLAQHVPPWDAARLAVGMHGLAAERVVAQRKWRTLVASDLLPQLPAVAAVLALKKPIQRR